MQDSPRASLRDVARLAGVSPMTVSRVVNKKQIVAPATSARVQEAIRQLNYRPDPALAALAAYRTNPGRGHSSVLAFLDYETSAYNETVFSGAAAEAQRLGYTLERHTLPTVRRQQQRLWNLLYHRGIRGIILGSSLASRTLPDWDWKPFAAVSLSTLLHHPTLHAVTTDYFAGAALAVQYLQGKGARRIGFAIDTGHIERTDHRWLGGYLTKLKDQKPLIYSGTIECETALKKWMTSSRLDGVLTISRYAWQARPTPAPEIVFLSQFNCPPEVPCITYDAKKIGSEGVLLVHNLCLNHEFGLPAEAKIVNLHPDQQSLRAPSADKRKK